MKNKTIIILAFMVMAGIGIVGNALANTTDESHYPTASSSDPWYPGQPHR
jgi:hypothetical protein